MKSSLGEDKYILTLIISEPNKKFLNEELNTITKEVFGKNYIVTEKGYLKEQKDKKEKLEEIIVRIYCDEPSNIHGLLYIGKALGISKFSKKEVNEKNSFLNYVHGHLNDDSNIMTFIYNKKENKVQIEEIYEKFLLKLDEITNEKNMKKCKGDLTKMEYGEEYNKYRQNKHHLTAVPRLEFYYG